MTPEEARANLKTALEELSAEINGSRVELKHLLADLLLVNLANDVSEQGAATLSLTEMDIPRSAYSNARSALEASQDLAYLVSDPASYDFNGALARASELVELEGLQSRFGVADAALGFTPREILRRSPEEEITEEGQLWSEECANAPDLVRRALALVRTDSARQRHWSGLGRKKLVTEVGSRWPELEHFALMQDAYYGYLSVHSHPRPRSGSRERRFENGRMELASREHDRDFPVGAAVIAVAIAAFCLRKRREMFDADPTV